MKFKKDQWIGLFLILFGVVLLLLISTIQPVITLDPNDYGPKFFPRVATIGLMVCGLGLLVSPGKNETFMTLPEWSKTGKYFLVLILYLFLMHFFGFLISTSISLFGLILMLAGDKKPNYIVAGIYSIAFTSALYGLFVVLLNIVLPRGTFFG